MPPRTNEFQELVSLIRRSLAKGGDTIEDSAMVQVQGLETKREIDILHTTSDGFSTIKIAVEAKDEGRKLDLTTFEQLSAKYRGEGRVCVDKFIVVSRNGFTEGVIEKARLMDVPLLTLDEARDFDWSKVGPEHHELRRATKLQFRIAPHIKAIKVCPPLPTEIQEALIRQGRMRYANCPSEHDHGSLLDWITDKTLRRPDQRVVPYLEPREKMRLWHP